MDLKNKTVLVTGANRGIGKELVIALLQKDVAKIYATARKIESLPDFSDSRVVPLELDITNEQQIKACAAGAQDVDILFNNAGVASFGSILQAPTEEIKKDMDTNFYGTLNMVREFVPSLEKRPSTAIVNVVTIGAFVNFPAIGGYCASKSALFSMSQGIRIELKPRGIQVHTVNPGPIDTDMAKEFDTEKTSPQITAQNILKGLENDEADIFPDPGGQELFQIWNKDYRDLENAISQMHNA